MMSRFQWWRRWRGGCWGRVNGVMFGFRWVRITENELRSRVVIRSIGPHAASVSHMIEKWVDGTLIEVGFDSRFEADARAGK